MSPASRYHHIQYAPIHWLLVVLAVVIPILFHRLSGGEIPLPAILVVAGTFFLLSLAMRWLAVIDRGDELLIRYGPLPLFRKRIQYEQITDVAAGRTSWVDGWGIHYVPGRGWTYNLWGFRCVKIQLGKRRIQIGTDDPDGLLAWLQERTASSQR